MAYIEAHWLRALAYGETKSPKTVDTLRDEACPICGNDTAYAGRECQICGYIMPIKAFGDPDVDKAKQLDDLKQNVDDQLLAADPSRRGGDLDDPAATGSDSTSPALGCPGCGAEFEPEPPQTADAPGVAPQTGPAEGDACPECNEAELEPVAQSPTPDPVEDPEADELDQDKDQLPDDEEQEDEDEEDGNPASRRRRTSKYRNARRTEGDTQAMNGLQAMAAQQQLIDTQSHAITGLLQQNAQQATQIQRLTAAVATLARAGGVELEGRVKVAMIRKRADEQNPAQPIPEPNPQPATQSTQEVKTPEAFADVNAPGMVPGSTQDVAADAVTTAYTPGQDIAAAPFRQLVDVTAPVEGTQGPRPINETRTEVDVRAGNPMNPQVAYPLGGPFTQQQRTTGSVPGANQDRTMASLRLARLQIQHGIAEGDDLVISQRIASDPNRTTEIIEHEIRTLSSVRTASQNIPTAPYGLVPRSAGVQRTVPPVAMAAMTATAQAESDEDLAGVFLDL